MKRRQASEEVLALVLALSVEVLVDVLEVEGEMVDSAEAGR